MYFNNSNSNINNSISFAKHLIDLKLDSKSNSEKEHLKYSDELVCMLNYNDLLFKSKRVILNIGGTKYDVKWKTLEKLPTSRLGKMSRIRYTNDMQEMNNLCDELHIQENEIYFDRSPHTFNCIIDFYRTNKLHLLNNTCVNSVSEELIYWGIDDVFFEQCCNLKYHQNKEDLFKETEKIVQLLKEQVEDEEILTRCLNNKKIIWNIMENPQTSKLAKVLTDYFYLKTSYL